MRVSFNAVSIIYKDNKNGESPINLFNDVQYEKQPVIMKMTGCVNMSASDYFVADSMRFMLANMNTPAMTQMMVSTTQIAQRGILIQRRPGTDTR